MGIVLPEASGELPMSMEGSTWWAIKRADALVFNPLEGDPDRIQLSFPELSTVTVTADITARAPKDAIGDVFDITVTGSQGTGLPTLCIRMDIEDLPKKPVELHLVRYDYATDDVNHDGRVTGDDLTDVAYAIYLGTYDPRYDVDRNGILDANDLLECHAQIGDIWTWTEIDSIVHPVDANQDGYIDFVMMCGFPEDFSGWGIRR
jgi:hypothetical protein